MGYNKRKKKIDTYITLKYANYSDIYITNFPYYASRHQVNIKVKKEKKINKKENKKMQTENISNAAEEEKRKLYLQIDIEMEMKEI